MKDKQKFQMMGAITNDIQYGLLIVVIHNAKVLQPNYDLDNSLCNKITSKALQELDVHNTIEDAQYHICHSMLVVVFQCGHKRKASTIS